jgi:RNA polymerase sigma-70 factor (ECF subfamily)
MPFPPQRLRALFDAHYDSVWRFLARHGVPAGEVDDAAQQVFMILIAKDADAVVEGKERGFLLGVALRVAQNLRRSIERRREVGDDALALAVLGSPGHDEALDQRRASATLDRILDTMPEDIRTVFVLFELEQHTMIDIADLLNIPAGTVASRLRRGRETFRFAIAQMSAREARPAAIAGERAVR